MAQKPKTDTLSKFTGTWMGVTTKLINENEIERPHSITWRIHSIDNSKNQIELTEINQRFESYEEIKKPKKAIYTGHVAGDSLFVEIKNPTTQNNYLVKLRYGKFEEYSSLIGTAEIIGTKDSMMLSLSKLDDDTSKYVKPKNVVHVVVMPPPPIEN